MDSLYWVSSWPVVTYDNSGDATLHYSDGSTEVVSSDELMFSPADGEAIDLEEWDAMKLEMEKASILEAVA